MNTDFEFEVESIVPASPERVWARVSTMEGVNAELAPIVRMTCPAELSGRVMDPEVVPLNTRVFRSWILLFGIVPIDYDDLTFVRIEPGRGFLESSAMLTQRRWVHQRTLEPVAGGCRVTDRVRFEPRLPFGGSLMRAVFRRVFEHRHRRLRRAFETVHR